MINLKFVPVNIVKQKHLQVCFPTLLHYLPYSSGSSEKAYQEMLKYVTNQDKIKTEKFRRLLPLIRARNNHPVVYKSAEKRSIHTQENGNTNSDRIAKQENDMSDLTNIVDRLPEIENPKLNDTTPTDNTPSVSLLGTTATIPTQSIANLSSVKGISALVAYTESSVTIAHADLSTAALPLSLHRKDDNFLITAVVQDVNQMYFKFAENVDHWSMLAQQEGLMWYGKAEEFVRQCEPLQDVVRERTATLMQKSTIWFAEKESAKISEKESAKISEKEPAKKSEKAHTDVSKTEKSTSSKTEQDSEQALSKALDKIKSEIKKALEILSGLVKKKMSESKKPVQGK